MCKPTAERRQGGTLLLYLDLPDKLFEDRVVVLEPETRMLYRQIQRESYAALESGGEITANIVLTRLLRLQQLTGGFLGGDESSTPQAVSTAKLDALSEIIDSAQQEGQKLVIIARFVAEIHAIEKMLKTRKIRYALIMGGIRDRDAQVAA